MYIDDRRGTTDYLCTLIYDGALLSWKSKKHSTVALSSLGAVCMNPTGRAGIPNRASFYFMFT